MEETFEDFDSDDQEFDAFSDDEIANVLELMSGGRSVGKEESAKQQSPVRQERLTEQQPAVAPPLNPFDAFLRSVMEEPNAEVQVARGEVPLERQSGIAQTETSEKTTTVTDFEHYFDDVYGSELSWCSSPRSLEKDGCKNASLCADMTGFKSCGTDMVEDENSQASKNDFDSSMDPASHESTDRSRDNAANTDSVSCRTCCHGDANDLKLIVHLGQVSLSAYQLIETLETNIRMVSVVACMIVATG